MKDEIKEFIEFRTDEDGTYFHYNDKDNIEQWSYKLDDLKDYITNLQKSQETLIKNDNEIITNLQEELKSANESISWWQNRFNAVEKEKVILKSRNEKAIDYIKEHIRKDDEYPAYMEMLTEERDELLNILQGGDE